MTAGWPRGRTPARDPGWAAGGRIADAAVLDASIAAIEEHRDAARGHGGLRNVLDLPAVAALAQAPEVRAAAEAALGASCFATRGILFDKTPGANWKVIWHQDLTIAVAERVELDGFGPWTVKEGVAHVQPPTSILESMLAVRIHLDDCGAENGPLRVIPGSHRSGRLSAEAIEAWRRTTPEVECLVPRGGILAFRPLLLHASSPARQPGHRRVLHLELAAVELPPPLRWHRRVGGKVATSPTPAAPSPPVTSRSHP